MCHLSPNLLCGHNEDGGLYYDVMLDKIIKLTTRPMFDDEGKEYTAFKPFAGTLLFIAALAMTVPFYIVEQATLAVTLIAAVVFYMKTKKVTSTIQSKS